MLSDPQRSDFLTFAGARHPFDLAPRETLEAVSTAVLKRNAAPEDVVCEIGEPVDGLYLIRAGQVDLVSSEGDVVAHLGVGDVFGDRGLLRDGRAINRAIAHEASDFYLTPAPLFRRLMREHRKFRSYFAPLPSEQKVEAVSVTSPDALLSASVSDLMSAELFTIEASASVRAAAQKLGDHHISCLPVVEDGRLVGMLTTGDVTRRVVAAGLGGDEPVRRVMTAAPMTLPPDAVGLDAMMMLAEHGIAHLPVTDEDTLLGVITTTNLIRRQALSSAFLIGEIQKQTDIASLAATAAKKPQLLAQLVRSGMAPHTIGRLMTGVTDTLTRRLVDLAEEKLGPAPVPYLWLACGSQGRMEQTGVSDQDNCLIISDDYVAEEHEQWFGDFAAFVTDGLDACGFVYCPGEMMASTPRWRVPLTTWREYFRRWITKADGESQLLASVMFDLRPIAGDESLFEGLVEETARLAKANSIFLSFMIRNALTHQPPLGLFGGVAVIRRGEHKDRIDLKHNGVVPIVDLGRVYALEAGRPDVVSTRRRLITAIESGVASPAGGRDLLDAFDLISRTRLEHQARQIANGEKADNFVAPSNLSELEQNHLRAAFTVVKTMQAALVSGKGLIT